MNLRALSLLAALAVLVADAAAGERYRFRDEQGVTVYSNAIPPHLVDNGYQVVGDDGRVIRVVPSKTELVARRAEEEARRKRDEANNQRRRADEELLKLYASPADVEAARDRKLQSIEGEIARIRADFETYIHKKADLESQGAERERAGQPPSPEIYENLKIIESQIKEREKAIEGRRLEQTQVRESFARDLKRVRELLGIPEPPPPSAQADATPPDKNTAPASNDH